MKVCVSSDYELGYADSLPFAGFESCIAGNPLAASSFNASEPPNNWPHACPHGYAQHLVAVDEGCEINFCVQMGAFNTEKLLPARIPPFRKNPKYKINVTETLVVIGIHGNIWVRDADGRWEIDNSDGALDGKSLLDRMIGDNGSLSSGDVAGISIAATVVVGVITSIVIFVAGRHIWRGRRRGYETLQDSHAVNNDTSA